MQLLHVLGYLYGCHGQAKRGAAYLLILDGEADKALATIARLETLDGVDHPTLGLLKSRALLAAGRKTEAHEAMRSFLLRRGAE